MPSLIFCVLPNDNSAEISSQRCEQRRCAHQSCCKKIPSVHSLQHLRQFSVVYFVRARLQGGRAADCGHEPPAAIILPPPLYLWACPFSTHDGFGDVCHVPEANISVVISDVHFRG